MKARIIIASFVALILVAGGLTLALAVEPASWKLLFVIATIVAAVRVGDIIASWGDQ